MAGRKRRRGSGAQRSQARHRQYAEQGACCGRGGNDALAGVLKNNIDFNAIKGKTKIPDQKWKDLLDHFNQPKFVLVNDNFEFPDLLGAAYEYLIKYFADSAGKKGGEFYTPAEVVRLLVQLVKPRAGNEIYDPTVGSGGFLIQSHQYVEEQGENANDLFLYGQDSNGTVWSICIMNMILHNITRFTIENADTLEDPQILDHGSIRKFDRVLANPPFSQNYSRATLKFASRFREWCPETGKKADLMFVQHMLASLKPDGHMATIMPHGVLFRGGKEKLRPEDVEKIGLHFRLRHAADEVGLHVLRLGVGRVVHVATNVEIVKRL